MYEVWAWIEYNGKQPAPEHDFYNMYISKKGFYPFLCIGCFKRTNCLFKFKPYSHIKNVLGFNKCGRDIVELKKQLEHYINKIPSNEIKTKIRQIERLEWKNKIY